MHALAITEEIVRRAVSAAEKEGASAIHTFHLQLGPVGYIGIDELKLCMEVSCEGTMARGASVNIVETKTGGVVVEGVDIVEAM